MTGEDIWKKGAAYITEGGRVRLLRWFYAYRKGFLQKIVWRP